MKHLLLISLARLKKEKKHYKKNQLTNDKTLPKHPPKPSQ